MDQKRQIRIWGKQRENIDVDLMTQIVIMLGRQLAEEAANSALVDGSEAKPSKPKTTDLSSDELGHEDAV